MRKSIAGKVQSFDQGDRTVTLEGGQTFHVGPSVDLTTIRTGDYVRVGYDDVKDADGRITYLADVVAKSSPEHPDHKQDARFAPPPPAKPAPAPPTATAAPASKVNTTESLKASKA